MHFFASIAVFLFSLGAGTSAYAVDMADKCAAAKMKEAGKYARCRLKEEGKGLIQGLEPSLAKCNTSYSSKWAKIESKGGVDCPTLGDVVPIKNQLTTDTDNIVDALVGVTPPTGDGTLRVEYTVVSIEPDDPPKTIGVEAYNSLGEPVGFSPGPGGSCAIVSDSTDDTITVDAVGEHCEEIIALTSDTNVSKTLTVKVYDPAVMDIGGGLLIKYVNRYHFQYECDGHGPFYLHPVVEEGWYPLGSLIMADRPPGGIVGAEVIVRDKPMIVVKELDPAGDALREPASYAEVIIDAGSGCEPWNGSVWAAQCPGDSVAIGVMTNGAHRDLGGAGYEAPDLGDMRCIDKDYTILAEIGDFISLGHWLEVFEIEKPKLPSMAGDLAPLAAGPVLGCWSDYVQPSCIDDLARLLLAPIPVVEQSDASLSRPKIDEYGEIYTGNLQYASAIRVPFTLVPVLNPADTDNFNQDLALVDFNVDGSPFYRVKRQEVYSRHTWLDALDYSEASTQQVTYNQGLEETTTESFSRQIGIELTAGGEAKFLGSGGSWEVKVSTQFGWDTTTSSSYTTATGRTWQMVVPAFTFGLAAQRQTWLYAFSEHPNGPAEVAEPAYGDANGLKLLQYPPAYQ